MTAIRCTATDLWTMAQTCWGEARGEPKEGIWGIAFVIRNRILVHPRWKGQSPLAVCRAPMQFSCWSPSDPNRSKMDVVSLDDPLFAFCLTTCVETLAGLVVSPVGHATHYFSDVITPPLWARGHMPVTIIGHHRFYEDIA